MDSTACGQADILLNFRAAASAPATPGPRTRLAWREAMGWAGAPQLRESALDQDERAQFDPVGGQFHGGAEVEQVKHNASASEEIHGERGPGLRCFLERVSH